jgi:hypothetical protein
MITKIIDLMITKIIEPHLKSLNILIIHLLNYFIKLNDDDILLGSCKYHLYDITDGLT